MALPLMPKATAVWLVDNTALTFDQIAEFCGLHPLEVQGVADGEVAVGIVGLDPIATGQLTAEAIKEAETDPRRKLEITETAVPKPVARAKGPRYTPVAKRQDRPNAISWLLRYHSELTDGQISKLVGTTKPTINSIRDRTHWNINNIKLEDPVSLGMCTQLELDTAVTKALQRQRSRAARTRQREAEAAGVKTTSEQAEPLVEGALDAPEAAPASTAAEPDGSPREELLAGAAVGGTEPETVESAPAREAPNESQDDASAKRERVFGPLAVAPATVDAVVGDAVVGDAVVGDAVVGDAVVGDAVDTVESEAPPRGGGAS